jgi:hypothetical protein
MPGETGVTVVTTLVCLFIFAREAAGASRARHSLRPLISRGRDVKGKARADLRGEIAELCLLLFEGDSVRVHGVLTRQLCVVPAFVFGPGRLGGWNRCRKGYPLY